ncbi:MAG: winged helix-turn-helix domain-containing protein [Methanoregula sp.]
MSDLLSIITASDKRRNLLMLLNSGPREWDDIKRILSVTSTGMLPQIKILEEEGLIKRDGRKFSLTPIGKVLATQMEPLIRTMDVLDKNWKFWRDHDLSVLPSEILMNIGDLGDYTIIENTDEEIFDVSTFLKNLSTAKTIKGLSHTVHPDFPDFFMSIARNGIPSYLIFTPNVVKILNEKYPGWIREYLGYKKSSLYITKRDFKFSYAVTDSYFSISLFYNSGIFDSKNDVTSRDASALQWGEQIFTFLLEHSEKIKKPD